MSDDTHFDEMNRPCCSEKTHWWARTKPAPLELWKPFPLDLGVRVAPDAVCQCGRFTYSQEKELLFGTPSIGIGTFVPEDAKERRERFLGEMGRLLDKAASEGRTLTSKESDDFESAKAKYLAVESDNLVSKG